MSQLKLTSMRLSETNVARLDEWAQKHKYWSRSKIADKLLDTLLSCASEATLYEMLSTYDPYSCRYSVYFKQQNQRVTA